MGKRAFHPADVRAILVVRLYFVGDVLLATPVLEALRATFPDAGITTLIKRRARDVLLENPHVDEVLEYDAVPHYHSPRWLWRLAQTLRRRRFDLAVDLTGDMRSSWLLFAADPAFRVGVNHAGAGFLLDRRRPYRSPGHVVDHLVSVVETVGAGVTGEPSPRIYLTLDEISRAGALLAEGGLGDGSPFVLMSPGANWAYRRWPADRFGRLAARVLERTGLRSVVAGTAEDAPLAESVVAASSGAAVSVAGRTGLRELAGLAGLARAFVGNDSGPMHVAASQGTPVVALFGPNTPTRFAPRGAPSRVIWPDYPCSPCSQKRCVRREDPCMESIEVGAVLEALEELLDGRRGRPRAPVGDERRSEPR